jgi:hypothetical protein
MGMILNVGFWILNGKRGPARGYFEFWVLNVGSEDDEVKER